MIDYLFIAFLPKSMSQTENNAKILVPMTDGTCFCFDRAHEMTYPAVILERFIEDERDEVNTAKTNPLNSEVAGAKAVLSISQFSQFRCE